ncbi:MAG: hypothetical protein QXL86_02065 [Candidatus Aenigmatarchaeota archaeon]
MEDKEKLEIRIGKSVRDALYYGSIINLDENDKRKLKEYIEKIKTENEVKTTDLKEIGDVLKKYGFSVRLVKNPVYNTLTIMFYDESKIKNKKPFTRAMTLK